MTFVFRLELEGLHRADVRHRLLDPTVQAEEELISMRLGQTLGIPTKRPSATRKAVVRDRQLLENDSRWLIESTGGKRMRNVTNGLTHTIDG